MSNNTIIYRSQCRLCGSSRLRKILHLDNIPFFDEIISKQNLGKEFLAPIDIFWCEDCKSVQSQHDVNVSEYYADYQYVASDSEFIKAFMRKLAQWVYERFSFKMGDKFIEIGSANGYQLLCFKELGGDVLGFEPASNLCDLSKKNGVAVVNGLFTGDTLHLLPDAFTQVQGIVLLHTFDHLLSPVSFLEAVRQVIDPERGVLILEVHDLSEIINRREISLFGHEHATFLHLLTMKRLLERNGFKMLDANFIPEKERRANSMLIAAGLNTCKHEVNLNIDYEYYHKYDDYSVYENFQENVLESLKNLKSYIVERVKSGKKIAGYGAWGRGSTTLAMANLTAQDLVFVCDKNPLLHDCFTPGSNIIIKPPLAIIDEEVDEVIVFCYGYIEEIKSYLRKHLDRGGKITSVIEFLID